LKIILPQGSWFELLQIEPDIGTHPQQSVCNRFRKVQLLTGIAEEETLGIDHRWLRQT